MLFHRSAPLSQHAIHFCNMQKAAQEGLQEDSKTRHQLTQLHSEFF